MLLWVHTGVGLGEKVSQVLQSPFRPYTFWARKKQ